jgi:peptidoglycan/xylan/chitin deacetylase (PgdA/CDA1 family)
VVLAYHRIRERGKQSWFDDALFGPDEELFEQQIRWIAETATPVSEAAVLACVRSGRPFPKGAVLVTFDDGYRDNFTIAAPILKKHSVPAIYFIPITQILKREAGWWDEIAWVVKRTQAQTMSVAGERYDGFADSKAAVIESLIAYCKQMGRSGFITDFLDKLRLQCGVEAIPKHVSDLELMTFAQVKELGSYGISVGGHTLSHCMLSRLDIRSQERELAESKSELEARLGQTVVSLAYPFGGEGQFGEETKEIARRVGYGLAFTMIPGINRTPGLDAMSISRIMPASDLVSFSLSLGMPSVIIRKPRRRPYCGLA